MSKNLDNVRNSLAHLLAMAVLERFPGTKLAIGPVIENRFYYDFELPKRAKLREEDLQKLEQTMRELITARLRFYRQPITRAAAQKLFRGQPYKLELIKEFIKEKRKLTVYYTCPPAIKKPNAKECFVDLCRQEHIKSTEEIPADAFKLTHIAGAYWRGSEKNPMLTRIYGAAFATKEELGIWLKQQDEVARRDHRKLAEGLELFTFSEEVGPGLPLWLPHGTIIKEELEKFGKEIEAKEGYQRVSTPHIARAKLYESSGHLAYFTENMFPPIKAEDSAYYLKPMNCPHTHMVYKARPRTWRELPIRLAEFGTVYRYERSGELLGILRTRGMTQNDAHIYCTPEQTEDEFLKVLRLHHFYYNIFGIKEYWVELALPDFKRKGGKYIKDPKGWKLAVEIIRRAMKRSGIPFEEKIGEAAFYGPKADFNVKSVVGKSFGASTNQLDFASAKRFGLTYIDRDGKEKTPYIIHRAPLGSDERLVGFLIEHYAGAFPVWLAPVQAAVLPVSERHQRYAQETQRKLQEVGIRAEILAAEDTLGKRIREAELQKIPYVLVVGDKEISKKAVSVRVRSKGNRGMLPLETFRQKIANEIKNRSNVLTL